MPVNYEMMITVGLAIADLIDFARLRRDPETAKAGGTELSPSPRLFPVDHETGR